MKEKGMFNSEEDEKKIALISYSVQTNHDKSFHCGLMLC